jgi:hypothetical protein
LVVAAGWFCCFGLMKAVVSIRIDWSFVKKEAAAACEANSFKSGGFTRSVSSQKGKLLVLV